jgi:uncharacterized membrane protein
LAAIRFFLSGICHQLPDHCLRFQGQDLPLCARCTGIFMGFMVGLLLLAATGARGRTGLPARRVAWVLALFFLLWAVDGANSLALLILERGGLYPPSNGFRLATGLMAGLALGTVFYPIWQFVAGAQTNPAPVLERRRALLGPLAVAVGLGALLFWVPGAPYDVWLVLVVASVATTLTLLNAALLVLLTGREGAVAGPSQLALYLAGGLLAALCETGLLALLRQALTATGTA